MADKAQSTTSRRGDQSDPDFDWRYPPTIFTSQVPVLVALDPGLSPLALRVALVIGAHNRDYGWTRPDPAYLADLLGTSKAALTNALTLLVANGHAEKDGDAYRLLLHPPLDSEPLRVALRDRLLETVESYRQS